jgi:hypothetical protein
MNIAEYNLFNNFTFPWRRTLKQKAEILVIHRHKTGNANIGGSRPAR